LIDSVRGRDRYLVETFDVAYAPSASVWLQLRRRPRPADHGVVALAPRDRELVGTAEEVSAVASVWGSEALIHLGREATAGALHTAGGSYRIVHLATRGVLDRRNPLFSYVELAPELNGDDGRLEVHEVYRMTLKTDLLVLTACQTGLGSGSVADVPNGDDWVSLVRAFVSAGANNVLATLWAIDDARTAVLAAAVHRHIAAGASYARALALAKRESLRRSDMAAPYYWAGLVLSGAQRRR